jgi:hypothetical protein
MGAGAFSVCGYQLHNSIARRHGGQGDCGLWISGLGKKKKLTAEAQRLGEKEEESFEGDYWISGLHGLRNK